MRRVFLGLVVLGLAVASCSSDPTTSEEYQELEVQLASVQQQLDEVTVERDALVGQIAVDQDRQKSVLANQEAVAEIIADPDSFGTREEVLDLLMTYATPDAVMDDVAFGAVPIRSAWDNTIFGVSADIETFATWAAADGSMSGSLWVWSGTARNGESFDLIGINTDAYDDDGLLTYSLVEWPYPNEYVTGAVANGN